MNYINEYIIWTHTNFKYVEVQLENKKIQNM